MKILESRLSITDRDKELQDTNFLPKGYIVKLVAQRRLTTTAYYPGGYKAEEQLSPHNPLYVTDVLERKVYTSIYGLILQENQQNSYHGVQSQQFVTYSLEAAMKWLQELKEEAIGENPAQWIVM